MLTIAVGERFELPYLNRLARVDRGLAHSLSNYPARHGEPGGVEWAGVWRERNGVTYAGLALTQKSPFWGIAFPLIGNDKVMFAVLEEGMQADYSNDAIHVPMTEERRKHARYKMDCPVAVLTPGRGKKRTVGCGWLYDIGGKGARFFLDHTLEKGERVSLEVSFQNPDGEITTIRFPSVVNRVLSGDSNEIAVSFLKGESYIRGKRPGSRSKQSPRGTLTKGSDWIN